MTVQTTYSAYHNAAYAGMLADLQASNRVSKLNADTATIEYGKGVVRSGEYGMVLPTDTSVAADFAGVVMRTLDRAYADGDTFGAPVDRDATVVTMGVIWVKAANDGVAVGEPAYLRVGSTNTGDFSNAAGTDGQPDESVAIPNARFLSAGDTGELVKLSLTVGG